ncbi:uncharacterized protein LACBIDRAFT_256250, partial [Laccaria bicolor S238N-H82]
PASARPNLNVMVNAAVTRITWASQGANGTVTATGVEFSCNGQIGTVRAKREVILSGGSVGSPQVLMLSGVGPRDVLESVGVDVVVELPGVGQHAQDHLVSFSVLPTEGLVELLLSLNAPGQVMVQAALQIPFSQAGLYVNSTSVFGHPVIDPQYYSHPADVTVIRQGLKIARTIGQTSPLSNILGNEISSGLSVSTDEEWEEWLRSNSVTEYHPSSTCAMMPFEMGGFMGFVTNMRVVDASIFPLAMSSHVRPSPFSPLPFHLFSLALWRWIAHGANVRPRRTSCYHHSGRSESAW